MSKLTRKELLKQDDAFVTAAKGGARWIGSHRVQMFAVGLGAAAAILATWGVIEYVNGRDSRASESFQQGLDALDGTVGTPPPAEGDEAAKPSFATEEEKWKAARDHFQHVVEEAPSSGVAHLAALYASDLEEKLGNKEQAEKGFLALVASLGAHDSLIWLAVERAALLQEARGDVEGALKTLASITNVDDGFYRDVATYHQARLYLGKGDSDRARNLFERIEKDFPTSPMVEKAREQLAALPAVPGDKPLAESKTP